EIIVTDCRAHAINFVGSNGRPYAAAAEQDTAFHDSSGYGACQRNGKVRIIIVSVIPRVAELHHLVASCAEQLPHLLLHLVSAMISGYADFHFFTSDSGAVRSGFWPQQRLSLR